MNIHPETPKEHYYFNRSESRRANSIGFKKFIEPNLKNWVLFHQIKEELAPKIEEIKELDEIEVIKEANRRATDGSSKTAHHSYRLVSSGADSMKDCNLRFPKEKKDFEVEVD